MRERRQVVCLYQGHPRVLCPAILGHTRNAETVLAFQIGGTGSKPLPRGGAWKCLKLAEVDGAGPAVAADLKTAQALFERASRGEFKQRTVISSWSQLVNYCRIAMQHEPREQFRVLFLDVKNQLIADEVMNEGTIDHAPVYPREIARRALELSASAVILVHNHPTDQNSVTVDHALSH